MNIRHRFSTRSLATAGAIGAPLFVGVALLEGATRPGYDPWTHFVSELALSGDGWMQIANFLVCGSLMLAFAASIWRGLGSRWGAGLLTVYALALLVAGVEVTDPSGGYPQGAVEVHTLHGNIHALAGAICFTSLSLAQLVLVRRFGRDPLWRGWAVYTAANALVVFGFFVASVWPGEPAGVLQRVAIVAGWSWVMLTGVRLRNFSEPAAPAPAAALAAPQPVSGPPSGCSEQCSASSPVRRSARSLVLRFHHDRLPSRWMSGPVL